MSYQTYNTKNLSYDFRSTYPCVEVDENQSPKVYTQLNTVNSVVFGSLSNANTSRIFGTDKTNVCLYFLITTIYNFSFIHFLLVISMN